MEGAIELTREDEKKVEERTAIGAVVVYEAIRKEGEAELRRPSQALAWSGLAAGLSMGFSLLGEGLLRSHLPDVPWRPLVVKLGYSLGFLIVVLGRQQLFTENTLTAILPLLHRLSASSFLNVLRLWLVVLLANLVGVYLFAWAVKASGVFEPKVTDAILQIGFEAMKQGPHMLFRGGIFAGWLIALMVWLLPFAEGGKVVVIIILTYLISLGGFPHIIAGSGETMYLTTTGDLSLGNYFLKYMLPTLAGNVVGGVSLVAALNHAQVVAGKRR